MICNGHIFLMWMLAKCACFRNSLCKGTQVYCSRHEGMWLKIENCGSKLPYLGVGGTVPNFCQSCRIAQKCWQKYEKNRSEIFTPKPFLCHISAKCNQIILKFLQWTLEITSGLKLTSCTKFGYSGPLESFPSRTQVS